ncbi:MAG: YkoF family thiamine/hydroxymethylpyrimidine-binding protein [Bdellovibrionota bacterium]
MIAEFSVYLPNQVHMSSSLAEVLSLLDKRGIEYSLGATSTSIRGDARDVFDALKACRDRLKENSDELVMNINIVERREERHTLGDNINAVLNVRGEKKYV